MQQVKSTTKTHGRDMSYESTKWSTRCHDGGTSSWFGIARVTGERVWVFLGGVVG